MNIIALDHIQLAMPAGGESEARSFYGDVLGFQEVQKPQPLRLRGGCWFRSGEVEVHLGVEEDFRPARKAHPAFRVSNIDSLQEHFISKGFVVMPDTALPEVRRFYVSDPFGNRIEFIS